MTPPTPQKRPWNDHDRRRLSTNARTSFDARLARRLALLRPDRNFRFLHRADRRGDPVLFGQVSPRQHEGRSHAERGARHGLGNHLDRDSVPHHDGHLRLGRHALLRRLSPAGRSLGSSRGGEAMDVEVPASRRPARNQHTACAARPQCEIDDDLRGRHSQLFRAGLSRQTRRAAGPLRRVLVRSHQGRRVPFVLRRVLRHQPFADDRPHRGRRTVRVRVLARRRQAERVARAGWQPAVRRAALRDMPRFGRGFEPLPAAGERVRASGQARRRVDHGRRNVPARVDPAPRGQGRGRLPADHAQLRRPVERRAINSIDRLHQIAGQARRPAAPGNSPGRH